MSLQPVPINSLPFSSSENIFCDWSSNLVEVVVAYLIATITHLKRVTMTAMIISMFNKY